MLRVSKVDPEDRPLFRQMVAAYWQELMPRSDVVNDPARWEAYFQEEFSWDGSQRHPYWATVADRRVGLIAFDVWVGEKRAFVSDLYVTPGERRQGYGAAMVRWLFSYLDDLGIARIDLDVRRDNPGALAFWQAQGFGIALYRLRQYRDPDAGIPYVGALSSDF